MANEDDELRARAKELVDKRRDPDSEPPESAEPEPTREKPKRESAKDLAKAAVAPGAGVVALIAIVQQLLSAHVSPEQLTALRERVDQLETDRSARRLVEFERDTIAGCRIHQLDGYMESVLPRRDQQVGPAPKAWFDMCPDLPKPTTGTKTPQKD